MSEAVDGTNTRTEERVGLPELADEIQCHKQTLFKVAKRLGITPIKVRDPGRGNQLVSMITRLEETKIRGELSRKVDANGDSESCALEADDGYFYLIQLEPEHDPNRIKIGFTTDLEGRLRKHRCSAPFTKMIKSWPCRRAWERTVIDCVSAGLEQLHTEVFRATSLEEVTNRADKFFSVMPFIVVVDSGGESV